MPPALRGRRIEKITANDITRRSDRPGGNSGGTPAPGPRGRGRVRTADPFSFTKSLLGDDARSDRLASVFRVLYEALDERKVSYGPGTL